MRATVQGAFARWVREQQPAQVLEASSMNSWLVLFALVGVMLAAIHWAPGADALFALPLGSALLCFLPALLDFGFALLHRRHPPIQTWGWVLALVGTTGLQFFLAGLMALSALGGATAFGGLLLFTAAFHGQLFRVTLHTPFLAVGTALAMGLAATFASSREHLALFAVIGPSALLAELYLGTFTVRHDQVRAEAERLHDAVQAQMLEHQERDVGRLSQALTEVLHHTQELHTGLLTAGAAADMLRVVGGPRGPASRAEYDALVRQLQEQLASMRERVVDIRQKSRRFMGSDPEAVDLVSVLDSVRQSLGVRYPGVDIHVDVNRAEPLRALVRGGTTTLRRVVENLVTNACEREGPRAARRVHITARTEIYSGRLEMIISDDGPGISPEQFQEHVPAPPVPKPPGTERGLYTSECLIRSSGGLLEWQNAQSGGAVLRVLLPQEFQR
ncbi:sensor histidine kinase [Stigmatella ashevillensis]|nr:HAMP domain-containing sensor histidine kinase [Stigmatella ashevillena]